jgi:hypothetical protein
VSDPEERGEPDRYRPQLPDPGPLRRVQALTAVLIGAAVVFTLLSDKRPGEVRWGTLVGLVALSVGVFIVLRRRGRPG